MRYYIGVDGGGTKTAFAIADDNANIISRQQSPGSSYKMYGLPAVLERLRQGVDDCLSAAGAAESELAGLCFGMPCYGENPKADEKLKAAIKKEFAPAFSYVTNDVEVGWAGSLSCGVGINIVAGTGSIAFGCDESGTSARCGGWNEFFGDEGSCHWVGRRVMELFSKQADGRIPRAALYDIIRTEFSLQNDYLFMDIMEREFQPKRDRTAGMQIFAEKAALAGDQSCVELYKEAATELALIVDGVRNRLDFGSSVKVSYSGGLFRAGKLVLEPFSRRLESSGCTLVEPMHDPLTGAVLLAIKKLQNQEE